MTDMDIIPRVAVAIVVHATVHDLKGNECLDKLVVSVDQTADPLIGLNVLDVEEDLPAQALASFEPAENLRILGYSLCLAVNQLEAVEQVRGGDG